jgi:hypothetical protein
MLPVGHEGYMTDRHDAVASGLHADETHRASPASFNDRTTQRPPPCGRAHEGAFREELTMTATEAPETGGRRAGSTGIMVEQQARRQGDREALGLLLGILGVLLVLAVTVGAAPPIGR